MKRSVVLLALPLVMVFAAEKPAPKKTKSSAQPKSASKPTQQAPRVVIPPGFGPRVTGAQPQSAASPAPARKPQQKPEPKRSGYIKPSTSSAPAVSIPAGATEVSPNVFRYTDTNGIAWLYSKTPFGVSKTREDEAAKQRDVNGPKKAAPSNESPFGASQVLERNSGKAAAPAAAGDITAKDLGNRVQFERTTPFGTTRWVRNKPELTDEERAIWEREQKKSASTADRAAESRP
jgi:hypothetical protein